MDTIKILASDLQNLTDARFFAAWEVDWLAFNLDPTADHYLPPVQLAAIKEWVEGPKIAGAFGLQSAGEIRQRCLDLNLDAVYAGMLTSLETLQELGQMAPVLKEIVVEPHSTPAQLERTLEEFTPWVQYFILNFDKNGITWTDLQKNNPISSAWLQDCCARHAILLSIDLDPDSIAQITGTIRPAGFSLKGGEEEKTGFKSFDVLDEILESLRNRES